MLKAGNRTMINIDRAYDAARFNQILNDPAVRPWVADAQEGTLDVSPAVANRNNILLMGDHGGCMFFALQVGLFEVHTAFLPSGRGEWSRNFLWGVGLWMFTRTHAVEILTRVPHGHLAARTATLGAGMHPAWTREDCCVFRGRPVPVEIFSAKVQDWVWEAPWLAEMGQSFHDSINQQAAALGITEQPHEDDDNHNRIVGLCFQMFRWGQAAKATVLYNRWALASRHRTIELVQADPPVVKFDVGFLTLENGALKLRRAS